MLGRSKPQPLDKGTIAPLIAGYLALLVMTFLLATNVIATMTFASRLQGVVDLGAIYAHERSLRVGQPKGVEYRDALAHYLANAPAAKAMALEVINLRISGVRSTLELCAVFEYPLAVGSGVICRSATAESFLL